MMFAIGLAGLLAMLLLLYELFRRNRWIAWTTFLILPFVLLPWWIHHDEHTVFAWIKIYSVVWGASWLLALRFTPLKHKKWAVGIMYLFLVLNIAEAVVQDSISGRYLNYMNAVTGILLIIVLPRVDAINIDQESRHQDLVWEIPLLWIIGYTIWNLMFIYMTFPIHTGIHVAVLGSALLVGLVNNKVWLQARAITLGTFAILLFTYVPMFEIIYTPRVINQPAALVGVSIGLGLTIIHCVRVFLRKTKNQLQSLYYSNRQ